MIAVADTSFVLAVGNIQEARHKACVAVFNAQRRIYLPQSALGEICYMLGRRGGNRLVGDFLLRLPDMKYELVGLIDDDIRRTGHILKQYSTARLDFVDATIAAVAERLNISRILTLDHTDFSILRPNHVSHFELLPAQP